MNRREMRERVTGREEPWDMVVIGGGATGVGIAVDAASRGYDVLLVEQSDFGQGTSSRSTKLVHGGVRYLQQGNVSLVMEALKERGILREIAPHLVSDLRFVVPSYDWWQSPFYGVGLKVYDLLARRYSFGPSRNLSKEETLEAIPALETEGLRGGVEYHDGQFDDARLLVNLVQTAARQGATVLNYARVEELSKNGQGFVDGVRLHDLESGQAQWVHARSVVNATGPFADAVRRMDDPSVESVIVPSQGTHVVLDSSFLRGDTAIMVPRTSDGRVMFAIPWHGHTVLGTTDVALEDVPLDPVASEGEIDFLLETAERYLVQDPTREDVLSVFVGIRPLARAAEATDTAELSRDHTILISPAGLVTVAGGKWTTYRHMAEDCVNQAALLAGLEERPCVTRRLDVHGFHNQAGKFGDLAVYGSDAPEIEGLVAAEPGLGHKLHDALPVIAAQVVWAARFEMARTVDDVLSRRTRALFLNARAATAMAPEVARLLAAELGRDEAWESAQVAAFEELARTYLP